MDLYVSYGGRSRLSYFDAFHVETAKRYGINLLTSDGYILTNATALGVVALDLASFGS